MREVPESFLFINVSRIGDTMFCVPAIRAVAVAYPACEITALAHPKRAEVLHNLPFIKRSGAISKRSAWLRGRLGRVRYDYAIVYGFDEPLIRYALRVARRVVAFRQRHSALNDRLYRCVDVPMFQSEHAILSHLRLPAALGVPAAGCRLSYHVTREESAAAQARLAGDVPRDAAPLVGFQVASFPTKGYRDWPIANFADLADRIIREWPRAHFLLYGGSEELVRVNWLKEKLGKRATQYAGRLTLRETAAVMSLTDLYVGVDTGPSHIMSAFDVPLIGMYHCLSSSRDTGALDHPYFYPVDHPRPRKDCSVQVEMAEITVDMVFAQVTRALGRHAPSVARRHL